MRSTVCSIAAIVIIPATLTACSDGDKNSSTTQSNSVSASKSVAANPGVPVDKIVNEPDARKDVTVAACVSANGGWKANGEVKNSTKKTAEYTIVMSFTNAKSTVLARAKKQLTVQAGKTQPWAVSARFNAPKDVMCVLRGVDRT